VSKHFSKGRMAVVDGRLQVRSWTDNEGNKRRNAEIQVENVYFGDSKSSNNDNQTSRANVQSPQFQEIEDDGPLPF
jgi:single-strand DNA-binding protein